MTLNQLFNFISTLVKGYITVAVVAQWQSTGGQNHLSWVKFPIITSFSLMMFNTNHLWFDYHLIYLYYPYEYLFDITYFHIHTGSLQLHVYFLFMYLQLCK